MAEIAFMQRHTTMTTTAQPTLESVFSGLVRHHVATCGEPLPPARPGITWVWAQNGIYKRGSSGAMDALVPVVPTPAATPGLAALASYVTWRAWPRRLPGDALLTPLLHNARQAFAGEQLLRPIEKQYFVVHRDDKVRLVAPRGQNASGARVSYQMPAGEILVDIHSHHAMRAFFSGTDDADDTGLSVSAVVGSIFSRPEILVRINVYGQHWPVSALTVFDSLGPFRDRWGEGIYADADD